MANDLANGSEKRFLPRLSVSHEVFRYSDTGKFFAVADLSVRGMAIRIVDREDFYPFMVGAEVRGTLSIRREKFAVHGSVRHLGGDLVGIEFDELPASVAHALSAYLDPVTQGRNLRLVPSDDDSILFASASGTEVFFDRGADGRFSRLTVMILGALVRWDETTGLRTGMIRNSFEESLTLGITRLDAMLFEEDAAIDPQKLNLAKHLVSSSNFPEDLKLFCLRRLEGASA